jgi:hypothetical protein
MQLPLDVILSDFHRLAHGAKLKALAGLILNEYVRIFVCQSVTLVLSCVTCLDVT